MAVGTAAGVVGGMADRAIAFAQALLPQPVNPDVETVTARLTPASVGGLEEYGVVIFNEDPNVGVAMGNEKLFRQLYENVARKFYPAGVIFHTYNLDKQTFYNDVFMPHYNDPNYDTRYGEFDDWSRLNSRYEGNDVYAGVNKTTDQLEVYFGMPQPTTRSVVQGNAIEDPIHLLLSDALWQYIEMSAKSLNDPEVLVWLNKDYNESRQNPILRAVGIE